MSPATPPPEPVPSQRSPRAEARRVGAIVLAAGPSTRMGTPKQLLAVDGQPLLVRTVAALLDTPVWPVIVVLGARAEQIRPALARLPVITIENPAWSEGMASSLRAGIIALQQFSRDLDAALVALCDQPAFSSEVVMRLLAAERERDRPIIAARYSLRQGAPAIFRRELFPTLAALTGEEGARALLNGNSAQVAAVDLPALAFDLDTPEDYAALGRSPTTLPPPAPPSPPV